MMGCVFYFAYLYFPILQNQLLATYLPEVGLDDDDALRVLIHRLGTPLTISREENYDIEIQLSGYAYMRVYVCRFLPAYLSVCRMYVCLFVSLLFACLYVCIYVHLCVL